jgi:hypothetical protein
MTGLVPAIRAFFLYPNRKPWMPATSAGMTNEAVMPEKMRINL